MKINKEKKYLRLMRQSCHRQLDERVLLAALQGITDERVSNLLSTFVGAMNSRGREADSPQPQGFAASIGNNTVYLMLPEPRGKKRKVAASFSQKEDLKSALINLVVESETAWCMTGVTVRSATPWNVVVVWD